MEPVLKIRRLSKTFPGQRALREVSLEIHPGEVHALLGENGSGKSTLIKCLAGYHSPDPGGELWIDGREVALGYPASQAHELGLAFVHQDLGLVPSLTVLENLALGRGFRTGVLGRVQWKAEAASARQQLAGFAHHIEPGTLVRDLSRANQTLVAIARALRGTTTGHARVLVLDEPTASLPDADVDRLFTAVRRLTDEGVGVLYVSHRLPEIFRLADNVSVLRDGQLVGSGSVAELDQASLIKLIVGRDLPDIPPVDAASAAATTPRLAVTGLSGQKVRDVSFSLGEGEVVGIAGLVGAGRSELCRLLFGAQARTAGSVAIDGAQLELSDPRDAMSHGVALVPEDRHASGAVTSMTVGENITLASLGDFMSRGRLDKQRERAVADDLVDRFGVRPADPGRRFMHLSGGNQQKVVLAKWLHRSPKVLLLDEPFQGVDVGAKSDIVELISGAAREGTSVVMVSSDLSDLVDRCDRLLVMRDGAVVASVPGHGTSREHLTELIFASSESRRDP